MDTLTLIKKKLNSIQEKKTLENVKIILNHIAMAEKHFNRAMTEKEPDFFNDAIYRTNQAYEGIIRLAYEKILNKNEKNKSNVEIEESLLKEKIINQRTKDYISLYRKIFRNCSIHNYKIVFLETDVFLAINNVISFLYTLVNQLLINDFYIEMKQKSYKIAEIEFKNKKLPFEQLLKEALVKFPEFYFNHSEGKDLEYGFYTIGQLEVYLRQINKDWKIITCPTLIDKESLENGNDYSIIYIPDLVVESKEEKKKIIIDICLDKNFKFKDNFIHNIIEECLLFQATSGIIFQITEKSDYDIVVEDSTIMEIDRVYPKNKEVIS